MFVLDSNLKIMEVDGIRAIVESSKTLVNWNLSIIGGSIAILLSNNYLRPSNKLIRASYFLFIIGWYCLGLSILYGNHIAGRGIAAELKSHNIDYLKVIVLKMNIEYGQQIQYLHYGLYTFGIWLIFYLVWFIFHKENKITNF